MIYREPPSLHLPFPWNVFSKFSFVSNVGKLLTVSCILKHVWVFWRKRFLLLFRGSGCDLGSGVRRRVRTVKYDLCCLGASKSVSFWRQFYFCIEYFPIFHKIFVKCFWFLEAFESSGFTLYTFYIIYSDNQKQNRSSGANKKNDFCFIHGWTH